MRQENPQYYYNAERTIYVAKDGDDTFSGTNRAEAVQTITQALVLAAALSPGPGSAVGIQILDAGVYTEDLAIPDWILIQGRQAALVGNHTSGGGCFIEMGSMLASSGTLLSKNSSTSNTAVECPFVQCTGSANGFLCTIGEMKLTIGTLQVEDGFGVGQTTTANIKGTYNTIEISGSGIGLGLGSTGVLEFTGNDIEVTGTGTGVFVSGGGTIYLNSGHIDGGANGTGIDVEANSSLYLQAPAVDGGIFVDPSGRLEINENSSNYNAAERSGFILEDGVAIDDDGNSLAISVDAGTRTLTLTPTGGTFTFYTRNSPNTIAGADSVQWTDVEGPHFFYYPRNSMTLTHTTVFNEEFIYGPDVFVAFLIWDATNQEVILDNATIELHGIQMSGAAHVHFHNVLGAQWYNGLALNNIIADSSGNNDTSAQFGVDSGEIADEDLRFATPSILSTAGLRILYLEGAAANVRQIEETGFSVLTDVTAGVGATGRLVWNEFTGGAWQLSTVANNDFVLCHVFAVGCATTGNRVYAIVGQGDYPNLNQARAGAEVELGTLAQILPFPEVRPIATLIYQTSNSYGNTVQGRVRSTGDGDDYIDWRSSAIPGGSSFTPTEHNSLAGRSDPGAHSPLVAPTDDDQVIELADAAGTYKLDIQDSSNASVATIDSLGNANVNSLTVASAVSIGDTLSVDTINEETAAAGVTIDGVLCKDSDVQADSLTAMDPLSALVADSLMLDNDGTAGQRVLGVGPDASTPGTISLDVTSSNGSTYVAALDIDQTDINSALDIVFASGKGVNFGDETLKDYDEGTWTPVLTDGTNNATASVSSGTYTRKGRNVTITMRLELSSKGSISGSVYISGLPFTSGAPASSAYTAKNLTTNAISTAYIPASFSQIWLLNSVTSSSSNGGQRLTDTDLTNSSAFELSIEYEV